MEDIIAARGRIGTSLATVYDADGKTMTFDIREDEEQNLKLQETVELLLAAGYFRARIKGLTAFDKVVGGMAWCISQCNLDVDVDILYQESSSIGQKIVLTEKIVRVLPQMKCPHSIQPHQIQGLDFVHIFPVIQWLVKEAIKAREDTEAPLQSFALAKFHERHTFADDVQRDSEAQSIRAAQKGVEAAFPPQRTYKKPSSLDVEEKAAFVSATLLEYGVQRTAKTTANGDKKGGEKEDETALIHSMSPVKESGTKISAQVVASLMNAAEIQEMASDYSRKEEERLLKDPSGKASKERRAEGLAGLREELESRSAKLESAEEKLNERLGSLTEQVRKVQEKEGSLEEEQMRIEELEDKMDKEVVEELKSLLAQHEEIKTAESTFKDNCKKQMVEMNGELERLQTKQHQTSEETEIELKNEHQKKAEEMKQLRLKLAKLNQETALLQRNIDQVPSQAELVQYQRRFLELYNQVASQHRETKQFYILHNTLADVRALMEKEISLLDSISSLYHVAITSELNKADFLKQLDQAHEGIKNSLLKTERQCGQERLKRDQLKELHQEILDKQRLYFRTAKDFQEECKRNEILTQQLEEANE